MNARAVDDRLPAVVCELDGALAVVGELHVADDGIAHTSAF
jgi:hypothetical protein